MRNCSKKGVFNSMATCLPLAGALLMAGCSGGGSSPGVPSTGATVTLNSFTVTGTDAKAVDVTPSGLNPSNGSLVIDGTQDSGVFAISWNTATTATEGEIMELDLSVNADGASDDLKILGQNCDLGSIGSSYCPSNVAANIVCTFDSTAKSINCPQDGLSIDTYSVGSWLSAHSGTPLYLRLKASVVSDSMGNLDTQSLAIPVSIQ